MKTRLLCLPVSAATRLAMPSVSSRQRKRTLHRPIISAIGILALTGTSQAASFTWDGQSTADANWTTAANWNPDGVPVALDLLTFDNATRGFANNNFAANTQFNSLTFGSGGTGEWVIYGNAINLGGNVTSTRTSNTAAINLNLALLQTTTVSTTGTLGIGGVISGGFGLIKTAAGPLTLSGANTYTGPTSISAGTVRVSSLNNVTGGSASSNLGAPTTVADGTIAIGSIAAGALVYIGSGETSDRVINLAGTTFGVTLDQSGTGVFKLSSPLTATGVGAKTLTLQGSTAGTGEISGAIVNGSGTTGLTKVGSGTWTLSGAAVNTYTGTTTVNRGTLSLDYANLGPPTDLINSGSALILGGGTLALKGQTGAITTSQTFASTTINPGASAITPDSNSGTATDLILGAITRTAGGTVNVTLPAAGSITTTTANAIFTDGQQTILDGATVGANTWAVSGTGAIPGAISGLATYDSDFIAGKDVDAVIGASGPVSMTVNSVRFNGNGAANVTLGGAMTIATGGILVTPNVGDNAVSIAGSTLASGNLKDLVVIQNNTTGVNSTLTIGAPITGAIGLAKSGAGTLILTAANTYTGITSLNGGTVNLGVGSTPLGTPTTALNSIVFKGGTLQYSAANTIDYSARFGGTTVAPAVATLPNQLISIDTNGQNVTFASAPGLASAGGTLTKSGLGTLILNAAAAYTGTTTISGGTLQLNGAIASSNIVNNASLVFFQNSNPSYNGVISGSGTVARNAGNSNAAILTGANTYTGATEIVNGVLGVYSFNSVNGGTPLLASSSLGAPTTVATGTIKIGAGSTGVQNSTLRYFGDGETTDRVLELAGPAGTTVTLDRNPAGSGLWKLTGNVTSSATGNKTLILTGAFSGEIAGAILDSSVVGIVTNLQKNSSGTWTVSGNNTFTGTTAVTGGILRVSSLNSVVGGTASSSLGAPTTVANGTIAMSAGGALTYTGTGETTDRAINLSATTTGGVLDQSGTGLLKFTSNFTATGAGSKTLTLQGSTAGTGEISGVIVNNSATNKTSLTKTGSGMWTLGGTNTYTGNTTVSAGTLSLANAFLSDISSLLITTTGVAPGVLNLTHSDTDIVGAMVVNGTPVASGVYGAIGAVGVDFNVSYITGTGKIQVTPSYGWWASANANNQTANLDFDNDGVKNGVEYFMGRTGSSFTANPSVVAGAVTWTNGGNIPITAYGPLGQYVVETSPDLVTWTPATEGVGPGFVTTNTNGPGGSLTYTLPTGAGKLFARLVVRPN
ncbi:MAG: autotransporter-associated beta strand repeat-containing protein [Verrucomicrobiota bacterium]